MKRLMLGMAAVMMTCAAWSQAPAEGASPAPFAPAAGGASGLGPGAVSR